MEGSTVQNPQVPLQQPDPHYNAEPVSSSGIIKKILLILGIFIVIIVIVMLVIFFVSKLKGNSTPREVTLTYWGVWEDPTVIQPILDDFHKDNPNITVKYEKQDIKALGKYIDRLTTRMNNGTGPDIVRFHSSWVPQMKNLLLPFPESVVKNTALETDYYKTVQYDMKNNGAYYGIPMGIDTLALFVNTGLFEKSNVSPPLVWEDLRKIAVRLTTVEEGKIKKAGIALGTYDNVAHASDIISLLFMQNGADMNDLNGPSQINSVETLGYYTSYSQGNNNVWDATLDNSKLAFAKGNLGMYFGYSWDIFDIDAKKAPDLRYQIVKVPSLMGRKETVASYWAEGVSSKSKYSKEAFQFMEYISKPQTLQKLYALQSKTRLFGSLYPRKSMAPLLKSNPLVYPFIEQADDAKSTMFASDTFDNAMNDDLEIYLGNAINSINNDHTSAQSAVETLSKGVAQIRSHYAR